MPPRKKVTQVISAVADVAKEVDISPESVQDVVNETDNSDKIDNKSKIVIEFLQPGLTIEGKVWKAGDVLKLDDDETATRRHADSQGNLWYDLTADQQKDRYGKVFFEKR